MVWQEKPSFCELAETYFYDVIADTAAAEIPADISRHIEHCAVCQKRIDELKQILQTGEAEHSPDPLAKTLEWHFTQIDKPLGCEQIKPFLPAMAIPEIAIHIPTPVTVHLDQCKSCAESLRQIRSWKLSNSQYRMLSEFFTSLQNHHPNCACLQTLPHLHRAIQDLKEQNSGIVTVFHLKPQEGPAAAGSRQDLYPDWPIRVEVWNRHEPNRIPALQKSPWYQTRVSGNTFHRIFKPLLRPVAVAAAFLIAFSLVLRLSTPVQGLDPVYNAMKHVDQIYIARYAPQSSPDPIQEQWLSASAGVHLNKTGSEEILQNSGKKVIQSRNLRTGEIVSVPMPDDVTDQFQAASLLTIARLLPFHRLSQAPQDARWILLPPDPASPDLQVYELTWKDTRTVGESIFRKWRCYVDSQHRLKRGEWYKKFENQSDYALEYYTIIEYPREQEILARVQGEY